MPIVISMDGRAIVPPMRGEGFVELARSRKGRVFEKQILNYGDLLYPGVKGGKVHIDDAFADKLIDNFSKGYCDIVQVPVAGAQNEHTEDPLRNIGEVIALKKRDNKIYAQIDARDEAAADKLGKTLLGASAMLHLNYEDTHTKTKVGPTLLHVAVTNRPYITGLEDYEEVLAASADGSDEGVVMLSATDDTEEGPVMTLDELLAELKTEHGIDIAELQSKAEQGEVAAALSNKIEDELGNVGVLTLSNGEKATADELIAAIGEAGSKIVSLSAKVDELVEASAQTAAERRVDDLVKGGRILPKNRDAQIKLLLSNQELFDELLPEKPLVTLSNAEGGEAGFHVEDEQQKQTVEAEIARLSAVAADKGLIRS